MAIIGNSRCRVVATLLHFIYRVQRRMHRLITDANANYFQCNVMPLVYDQTEIESDFDGTLEHTVHLTIERL